MSPTPGSPARRGDRVVRRERDEHVVRQALRGVGTVTLIALGVIAVGVVLAAAASWLG